MSDLIHSLEICLSRFKLDEICSEVIIPLFTSKRNNAISKSESFNSVLKRL